MNYKVIINYCLNLSYFELQDYAEDNLKIVYYYFQKNISDNPNDIVELQNKIYKYLQNKIYKH